MTERNTPHGDAVTTCRPPAHGRPYWHGALLALVIGSFGVLAHAQDTAEPKHPT
jgi:gamma-glutamyltranspeptidase/glutathione hydrolase